MVHSLEESAKGEETIHGAVVSLFLSLSLLRHQIEINSRDSGSGDPFRKNIRNLSRTRSFGLYNRPTNNPETKLFVCLPACSWFEQMCPVHRNVPRE